MSVRKDSYGCASEFWFECGSEIRIPHPAFRIPLPAFRIPLPSPEQSMKSMAQNEPETLAQNEPKC